MWFIVLIFLSERFYLSYAAACTGTVNANLEVTGAFVKANGTAYSIKSNEYATFTCAGIANTGVAVESMLNVECKGADKLQVKSAAGTEAVTAKWQTNDGCQFNSECTIQCSASTDCSKTDSQEYQIKKVHDLELKQINCTENYVTECSNKSVIYQQLTRQKPLGTGVLSASTDCTMLSSTNTNNITAILNVMALTNKCECKTTFTYKEKDSTGRLCGEDVFERELLVRNWEVCNSSALSGGMIALIVIVVLVVLLVLLAILYKAGVLDNYLPLRRGHKPSKGQVKRMASMNQFKLSELIAEANNPDIGTGNLQGNARDKEDPLYEDVEEYQKAAYHDA